MAKKIFKYRGKTTEEMQAMKESDFIKLLPSRERRTLTRGHTEEEKKVVESLRSGKSNVKTHCRNIIVMPFMVGKIIHIHNGKTFEKIGLTEDMIGHRFGEFALTRKRLQHSSPGVGGTKSSAGQSR